MGKVQKPGAIGAPRSRQYDTLFPTEFALRPKADKPLVGTLRDDHRLVPALGLECPNLRAAEIWQTTLAIRNWFDEGMKPGGPKLRFAKRRQ